jgi:hypothetical protein
MLNPMSMELLAEQVQRDHRARVAHEALLAQLPRSTAARSAIAGSSTNHPFAALAIGIPIRLHTANALRALATRLDPCATSEQGLVRIANSR